MTDKEIFTKLSDPKYFIETFLWIVDKKRDKVPFIFNPPQNKYYANRTHNDLILKARKEGFSSLIEAIWLHACIFIPNSRAVILSHEMEATKRHFERIKYYLQTMGDGRQKFTVDLDEDSQKSLKFPKTNSSFWIGTAGARAFGRGDDITHLHLSEVAHYENQEVLTSVLEACVPGAYKVMETTANGVGEMFHRLWKEAGDPQTGSPWKQHFFSWFDDPTNYVEPTVGIPLSLRSEDKRLRDKYNLKDGQVLFYRNKWSEMPDKSLMPQEYPSDASEAFLSSGRHVFRLAKIAEKQALLINTQPLYVGDLIDDGKEIHIDHSSDGPLKVWKPPREGRQYVIVADVAEGVPNGNWSVADVYDRSSWEQCAQLRLRINPGEYGRKLCTLGYYYNNAALLPENNNHGQATVEAIKQAEYPHLVNTRELWPNENVHKDGFPTNDRTRNLAITSARTALEDDTIFINSTLTLSEMETFIQNEDSGKFEAQKGCWDDCVITFSIGAYALRHMALDETYAGRAKLRKIRSFASVLPESKGRRSATGYR